MVRLLTVGAQTSTASSRSSATFEDNNCGQICSVEFSSKLAGRYYPLLRKNVNCRAIMRRMAHPPDVVLKPPPRVPPLNTFSNFTQNGQCPVKALWYMDQSGSNSTRSNRPLYFSASKFRQLMESDNKGQIISHYGDPYRLLKPTLAPYRRYIQNAHVAVVGTAMPWAEAMLINQGARRITTLEYRALVIEDERVVTITPSRFAINFLEAMNNGTTVRCMLLLYTTLNL